MKRELEELNLVVHAINAMALSECLEIGDYLHWLPVRVKPGKCTDPCRMTTWLPKHRVMCKIALLASKRTVIEIDERFMYANPSFSLKTDCPIGTVFYCTYTEDLVMKQDNSKTLEPRLLVYDVMIPSNGTIEPNTRYENLRTRLHQYLPPETMIVQWAGYQEHAHKIYSMKDKIGHEIECLACLGDQAGDLIKKIEVDIPVTMTSTQIVKHE